MEPGAACGRNPRQRLAQPKGGGWQSERRDIRMMKSVPSDKKLTVSSAMGCSLRLKAVFIWKKDKSVLVDLVPHLPGVVAAAEVGGGEAVLQQDACRQIASHAHLAVGDQLAGRWAIPPGDPAVHRPAGGGPPGYVLPETPRPCAHPAHSWLPAPVRAIVRRARPVDRHAARRRRRSRPYSRDLWPNRTGVHSRVPLLPGRTRSSRPGSPVPVRRCVCRRLPSPRPGRPGFLPSRGSKSSFKAKGRAPG